MCRGHSKRGCKKGDRMEGEYEGSKEWVAAMEEKERKKRENEKDDKGRE